MTTLDFQIVLNGRLRWARMTLRDLRLEHPEGIVAKVEGVTEDGAPWPFFQNSPLNPGQRIAEERAETVVAAARAVYLRISTPRRPGERELALRRAAEIMSEHQQAMHRRLYPEQYADGPDDEATYREEAPYGSEC